MHRVRFTLNDQTFPRAAGKTDHTREGSFREKAKWSSGALGN